MECDEYENTDLEIWCFSRYDAVNNLFESSKVYYRIMSWINVMNMRRYIYIYILTDPFVHSKYGLLGHLKRRSAELKWRCSIRPIWMTTKD